MKKTLYDCLNAKVRGDTIYCAKGHMGVNGENHVGIKRLARGDPLAFAVCQDCLDFDTEGESVMPNDRGWLAKCGGGAR